MPTEIVQFHSMQLLVVFSQNLHHIEVLQVTGRILLMLSGDAAMSSVAPFKLHDLLLLMCDHASAGLIVQKEVEEMKYYCIELAELLVLGQKHNCTSLGVNVIRDLVQQIKEVHTETAHTPEVNEISGSYNPSGGTAYYFTESGNQLHQMPKYQVNDGDKE